MCFNCVVLHFTNLFRDATSNYFSYLFSPWIIKLFSVYKTLDNSEKMPIRTSYSSVENIQFTNFTIYKSLHLTAWNSQIFCILLEKLQPSDYHMIWYQININIDLFSVDRLIIAALNLVTVKSTNMCMQQIRFLTYQDLILEPWMTYLTVFVKRDAVSHFHLWIVAFGLRVHWRDWLSYFIQCKGDGILQIAKCSTVETKLLILMEAI